MLKEAERECKADLLDRIIQIPAREAATREPDAIAAAQPGEVPRVPGVVVPPAREAESATTGGLLSFLGFK